uniref:TAP42-like protein n=1 Tax=Steinernema glaseri TaxID=37863 RepID=A0A1I7Y1G5_9BILA
MEKDSDEETLRTTLKHCEKVIDEVEEGKRSSNSAQEDLRDCITKLENLTRQVSSLALFSDNESFEELPTSSLHFMLLPCYLALATNALIVDRKEMVKYKEMAKVYYRDFLERLSQYGVIGFKLPWVEERLADEDVTSAPIREPSAMDRRLIKQKRYEQEAAMKKARDEYNYQLERNSEDDTVLRNLMMVTLCLHAHRAMEALEFLDEEIKILEFMEKRGGEPPRPPVKAKKLDTFIIAKSAEQKKVFGLGYPSIPTVTVDEWYDGMVASGAWTNPTANRVVGAPEDNHSSDEGSGDEADEQKRAKAQRWDEYKDDHRRGWGNTHNKG